MNSLLSQTVSIKSFRRKKISSTTDWSQDDDDGHSYQSLKTTAGTGPEERFVDLTKKCGLKHAIHKSVNK